MNTPNRRTPEPWVDPAEDAASMASLALAPAVEKIAATLRETHMQYRRGETEEQTIAKVIQWNRGKGQRGGHHEP